MLHVLKILFLTMAALGWSSCHDLPAPQQPAAAQHTQEVRTPHTTDAWTCGDHDTRHREAHLSNAMSLCRTACNPEERAESRTGETRPFSFRGTGKAFNACQAPRSTLHHTFGGFAQRTTVPICSFASRTYYIYVLRHILR